MLLDPKRAMMATRQAQSILQMSSPSLVADGRWGSYTNGVYARAPASLQLMVRNALDAYGPAYTPAALYAMTQSYKSPRGGSAAVTADLIPADKVRALLTRAAALLNLQATGISMADLESLAAYEAAQRVIGGVRYYNTGAVNRLGYTGLYQFGKAAWETAQKWSPVAAAEMGDFATGAKDAWRSTVAMVALAMSNARTLKRGGFTGKMDARALYGAHQQGPAGYLRFLQSGVVAGEQSAESLAFLRGQTRAKQLA